jgi:hypothetical protein
MILINNFKFFDKKGNNLNLTKKFNYSIQIKNNPSASEEQFVISDFKPAKLEAIVSENGVLMGIKIIESGQYYYNPEIIITDISGTVYKISGSFIELNNKNGFSEINLDFNPIGFTFPSVVYSGNLWFDTISTNLIENNHIFILEEFLDSNDKHVFDFPQSETDDFVFHVELEQGETIYDDETFFLFNIYEENKETYFQKENKLSFSPNVKSTNIKNGYKINDSGSQHALQLNIGMQSKEEGVFKRTLNIYLKKKDQLFKFVSIQMEGETETEDERFKLVLENFGITIGEQEELIFRESDISEHLPNYSLLNTNE